MNESLLPGPIRCGILAASLLTLLALPAAAAMEFDAARLNEIAARLPPKPAGFGRPISERMDGELDNFYGRTVEMDLRATLLAWELAAADYLLGERLAPETRRRLRANVERRVLQPFRDMVEGRRGEIYWLRVRNNWNAVCLSGLTGAALALEASPQERARFVAAAQHYIQFFLRSFTPDGYCAEGVGYWNYGFGHFLMLGEAVRQASGGAIDLFADPAATVMLTIQPEASPLPASLALGNAWGAGSRVERAAEVATYSDGRPAATWRLDAQDGGVVLRHGGGPGNCDALGARDVWVWQHDGICYMHYDGAGPKGWLTCLATSRDLVHWTVKGPVLDLGKAGEDDSASASYGVTFFDGRQWHMFYLGTPHVTPPPDLIPGFPYLTIKAQSESPEGPWQKQTAVTPFRTKPGTYYSATASPGQVIRQGDEYLMFFSASTDRPIKRTLSLARTKDLNGPWAIAPEPIVPPDEQVENSSLFYDDESRTWFLFTNHVGVEDGLEYTDAIWVYWTRDITRWNSGHKAVVLDRTNCKWSKHIIGLPSAVKAGSRLAIFYDGNGSAKMPGGVKSHMDRDVGLAWLDLPLIPPGDVANGPAPSPKIPVGSARAGEPLYPVKVSESGRYFTDQKGEPLFWLGTTQWQLARDYTLPEARAILERTRENGFAFAQVMLLGVGDGTKTNVHGEKPWTDNNPLTPNEAYFKNVDAVLSIAGQNGVVISMTIYHQTNRKYLTADNARAWAKWVARRYKDMPNILWCMVPEAKEEFVPALRELAAGLHEGDGGRHLVTVEPDPAPFSSSFLHAEKWLDFDSIQTWKSVELIYPMVAKDYNLKPAKPVLMAEGAYEQGSEYGFEVTPLWVRRQAYYSYLAGGHHAYGHNDSWRVLPTWKQALDAPGAAQLGILRRVLVGRKEWWRLVPDQSVLAGGGNTNGQVLNLAARHADGQWLMVYLGGRASFSVNLNKLTAGKLAEASWIDPRTGQSAKIGRFSAAGEQSFSTPAGWEDALLIVEPLPR
ncbi:MAG: DUF4038 domain-containing protein [Verrucomicrobiota bacterium]|jgi:predicted GH43/DUF377 family glycosyl hydrolase